MTETDDISIAAAELALGLLEGQERADALRRMLAEPEFAREVERWRETFGGLFEQWPEAEPGPRLARRILGLPTAAEHNVRRWQWLTGASTAAAAALALILVARPARVVVTPAPPIAQSAPLIAAVAPEGGEPFAALYDAGRGDLRLSGTVAVPRDRDAELWAIASDGVPRSLGVLRRGRDGIVMVTLRSPLAAGTTLAISIEPVGGSPTQAPTGPVVAKGKLATI